MPKPLAATRLAPLALGLLLAVRWVAAPPTTPQTTFVPLVRGTPDSLSIPGVNAAPRP